MSLGVLAAIGHGIALPALMFVFGDLTNSFINQAISRSIVAPLNNGTVNCSLGKPCRIMLELLHTSLLLYGYTNIEIIVSFLYVVHLCDYLVGNVVVCSSFM